MQNQNPQLPHNANLELSRPVEIDVEMSDVYQSNPEQFKLHLTTPQKPETALAYDKLLRDIVGTVMLAKVTEGSISLLQVKDLTTAIRKEQISMIAVINLEFVAKLSYAVEGCSKLPFSAEMALLNREMQYWIQFIHFCLRETTPELQKYSMVQSLQPQDHLGKPNQNGNKMEAKVIDIELKAQPAKKQGGPKYQKASTVPRKGNSKSERQIREEKQRKKEEKQKQSIVEEKMKASQEKDTKRRKLSEMGEGQKQKPHPPVESSTRRKRKEDRMVQVVVNGPLQMEEGAMDVEEANDDGSVFDVIDG